MGKRSDRQRNGGARAPGKAAGVLLFLCACCGVQAISLVAFFPTLRDAFSGEAIYHVDLPIYHFFHTMTRAFFTDGGTFNGYVPQFMSGYVQTFDFNGILQLVELMLPGLSTWGFLRLCLFVLVIGFPLWMYGVLRLFGAVPLASAVGVVLSLAVFHGTLLSVTAFFGMMNALLVLLLSLLGLATLHRALARGGWTRWLGVALCAALALAAHKTAVFTFGIPCLVTAAVRLRRPGGWGDLCRLSGVWAFAFLVNMGWILNLVTLRAIMATPKEWIDPDPLFVLRDLLGWGGPSPYSIYAWSGPMKLLLLAGGTAGAVAAWRGRDRTAVTIAGGGGLALFLLSYFGSCGSVTRLAQPIRYQPEVFLLATVCLCLGLGRLTDRYRRWMQAGAVTLFLLVGALVAEAHLVFRGPNADAAMTLPPDVAGVAAWIEERTDRAHRILMEDAYGRDVNPTGEPSPFLFNHLMPVVALRTGRAFAGGFQPSYYYAYRYVNLADGRLLDRPVGALGEAAWKKLIRDYNLGWCIVWSDASTRALRALPALFEDVAEIGSFHCFRTRVPCNWFLEGSGTLDFRVNRLRLSDVNAGENGVLLSFHWSPSLEAPAPARVVPQCVGGDPVPFIRVLDPPRRLEIRHRGRLFFNRGVNRLDHPVCPEGTQ